MTSGGQEAPPAGDALRLVLAASSILLVLDLTATAALYDRLPQRIAVHWTVTGTADNGDDRLLAWLLPMLIGFLVALAAVARRHVKPHERAVLAAAVGLAALHLFSASLLLLLANLDNRTWQQGSVGGRWMLLVLLAPGLVLLAGVCARRTAARRQVPVPHAEP